MNIRLAASILKALESRRRSSGIYTYQHSREKGYLIPHCALRDQGYSWTWCRVINWWRGVNVSKEIFASIFRIPSWVTRIWYAIVHPYRDIISLTVVFGPYLPAPFVNLRTVGKSLLCSVWYVPCKAMPPRFQDNWHMKVVRLLALRTGRLYPPGNIPGTYLF